MTRFPRSLALGPALVAIAALSACTITSVTEGDRVDYKSNARTTAPLSVPPDLTQLSRDPRYQPGGTVTASAFQANVASAAPVTPTVAPTAADQMRIERAGNERWLATSLTPEQLWPRLKLFWEQQGFNIATENAATGVMETDWAENRAKLPQDILRRTLGRVIEQLYSTGELDKFRSRIERTPAGSEIYITHRGMEEVLIGPQKDQSKWQPRATDPQLEAEFLSRLMAQLSKKDDADTKTASAATTAATTPEPAARARVVAGTAAATMQLDEGFERAWRRVGLALDRGGFTVEDRDRSNGIYYVRYVEPAAQPREKPGFFSRMFGAKENGAAPARYRIAVKSGGDASSTVAVLDAQGAPENGEVGKRIVSLLVQELR